MPFFVACLNRTFLTCEVALVKRLILVFLHAAYAAKHDDISDAIVCSYDTDVVVIVVSSMEKTGLDRIWKRKEFEVDSYS